MGIKYNADMSSLQIRPRFRIESPYSQEMILTKIEYMLSSKNAQFLGKIVAHHVVLSIPVEDQHYWSPQLHLEIEKTQSGAQIRGLFGPKPTVWTFFVFMYSVIGLFGLIALTFGYSQWSIGVDSQAFWGAPLSLVLLLVVYITARVGQHMGKEQMGLLRGVLDKTLED
jgi:hypothetical protein